MVKWTTKFQNSNYPSKEELQKFLHDADEEKLQYLINLWLSEGIPKIIQYAPEQYQHLRKKISDYLGIHPKTITLIGSARFG